MGLRTISDVHKWIGGAIEQFGDPSVPVALMCARWQENVGDYQGEHIACGLVDGQVVLVLDPGEALPLPVRIGEPQTEGGELRTFGADLIAFGVWTLTPSLNMPGLIHAYLILYGVPNPAPWEQLIVVP